MYKVAIITLSDRASQGIYDDKSGLYLVDCFQANGYEVCDYQVIADDAQQLDGLIKSALKKADLIITTGGTGLTSTDITVDVVEKLIDYEVRGMSIALHQLNLSKAPGSMFSRALCGVIDRTLIMTLPGSLKAVSEIMDYFIEHLEHGLDHLNNVNRH